MGRFEYRGIDEFIHSRIRLAVMSLLASLEEADFTYLRDQIGTTDGNLTTHIGKLRRAGYVEQDKRMLDGRSNTRFRLTDRGRAAFLDYIDHLQGLLPG